VSREETTRLAQDSAGVATGCNLCHSSSAVPRLHRRTTPNSALDTSGDLLQVQGNTTQSRLDGQSLLQLTDIISLRHSHQCYDVLLRENYLCYLAEECKKRRKGKLYVVWLRCDSDGSRDIDQPRVYFFTSCRSQSAPEGLAIAHHTGGAAGSNLPRGQTMSTASVCGRRREQIQATKRNIIKMSIAITVGFVICWAPLFFVTLVRAFSSSYDTLKAVKPVGILMVLSHSAVNPFIYICFSTRAVSAAFLQLCRSATPVRCRRRRRGSFEMFPSVDRRPVAVQASGCHEVVSLEVGRAAQDTAVVNQCRGTNVRRPTCCAALRSLQHTVTARYGVVTPGAATAYF